MKSTLTRATVLALAVVGLSMAPAAASPDSLELPGSPVVSPVVPQPGGSEASPDLSFCQVVGWWYWCRV